MEDGGSDGVGGGGEGGGGGGGGREKPNIIVTGTPGTGKTTTCSLLANATHLHHIDIGKFVKAKNLYDGWDEEFECLIINEELVCDELESMMADGGNIIDYHGCDFFPENWFDRVVVLQTNISILHDRLTSRGYMGPKLTNNIDCEIFQVLYEEARSSFAEDVVLALPSNGIEDLSSNVRMLTEWVNNWRTAGS